MRPSSCGSREEEARSHCLPLEIGGGRNLVLGLARHGGPLHLRKRLDTFLNFVPGKTGGKPLENLLHFAESLGLTYLRGLQGGILEEGPPLIGFLPALDHSLPALSSFSNGLLGSLLSLLNSLFNLLAVLSCHPVPFASRVLYFRVTSRACSNSTFFSSKALTDLVIESSVSESRISARRRRLTRVYLSSQDISPEAIPTTIPGADLRTRASTLIDS